MAKRVDFGKLSVQDAYDLAILVEDEARERYEEFVEQLELHHTPEAAEFFRQMVVNETKHGESLAVRRKERFGSAPAVVTRDMLWDVEAPEYDQVRTFMSVRQALEVALAAEIKAYEFFGAALAQIADPEIRTLFAELREEEQKHQGMVRGILAKVPPDSGDSADLHADPPVAH
ncbi:MAG: ferritin family protein [bacterium]